MKVEREDNITEIDFQKANQINKKRKFGILKCLC